jgi:hypothetical protein
MENLQYIRGYGYLNGAVTDIIRQMRENPAQPIEHWIGMLEWAINRSKEREAWEPSIK